MLVVPTYAHPPGQVSDDPRVEEDFFADRESGKFSLSSDIISYLLSWPAAGGYRFVVPGGYG
jgi:hypothetical protein